MKVFYDTDGRKSSRVKVTGGNSLIDGQKTLRHLTEVEEIVYDFPSLIDGSGMFYGLNAKRFSGDLKNLVNGEQMFQAAKLESFTSHLGSLKSGREMFNTSSLDESSLRNIADTINDISSLDKNNDSDWKYITDKEKIVYRNERGVIHIGISSSIPQDVVNECGCKLLNKGWEVYFNNQKYIWNSKYDISEANGYAPIANNWNGEVLTPNLSKLKITEVTDIGEILNNE